MTLDAIIDKHSILANLKSQNKKQLLQELSQALANRLAIDHRVIFETLLKREKLGSTGIGQGIAIPHGKMAALDRVHGLFARLAAPIEFDAIDGQPVDLVFVLFRNGGHGGLNLVYRRPDGNIGWVDPEPLS